MYKTHQSDEMTFELPSETAPYVAASAAICIALVFAFMRPSNDTSDVSSGNTKPVGPFTREEVAKHCTLDDAWMVIDKKVYDFTSFIDKHPGGDDAIMEHIGGDGSEGFHGDQHPPTVIDAAACFEIGDLKE